MARTRLDATLLPADIPVSAGESARLDALRRYRILNTAPEPEFDDLTRLAAQICGTPMAALSLVDADRAWLKSRLGLDAVEIPRDQAFCAHAIADENVFVVPDAAEDPRFASNPLVTGGPKLRFYAGAPLVTAQGHVLGTLCALDSAPATLTPEQAEGLEALARQAVVRLELRRKILELEQKTTYVTLLQEVGVAAGEASSLAEALHAALARICRATDRPVGHVYLRATEEQLSLPRPTSGTSTTRASSPSDRRPSRRASRTRDGWPAGPWRPGGQNGSAPPPPTASRLPERRPRGRSASRAASRRRLWSGTRS